MKKIVVFHIFLLIILEINANKTKNSSDKTKKEKRSLDKTIFIPGYPKNPKTDSVSTGNDNKPNTTPTTNTNTQRPITSSGKATGTTFAQVARTYYGLSQNSSLSNAYLQYPEPYNGWEEDVCQNSGEQSPINIPYESDFSIIKDGSNVEILSVDYNHLQSGMAQYQQNHMWGLGILDGGSIRTRIDNNEHFFYLSEVYFHLLSEHRMQNKQYPVEMQLVHYSSNYNNNHEKLIISILFDYSNNIENGLLSDLKVGLLQEIEFADFSEIVQKAKPFYYYKGGITIPPCSSNVHWIVFKEIQNMSYNQFERIKNWIESSNKYYYSTGYGNARGIKPLNGRKIYYETKLVTTSKTFTNGNNNNNNVKQQQQQPNIGQTLLYKFINIIMIISLLFL